MICFMFGFLWSTELPIMNYVAAQLHADWYNVRFEHKNIWKEVNTNKNLFSREVGLLLETFNSRTGKYLY